MPDLATCLSLQSFEPEDVAEINGFIQAAGGDQVVGVQAYLDSLDADRNTLASQVAYALGIDLNPVPEFDPETDPRVLNQDQPVDPVDNQIAENTILGPDGMPVRLYHGTNQTFDTFNDGQIFLTTQRGLANEHALRAGTQGARLIEANVQLENPLQIEIESGGEPDIYWLENAQRILADQEAGGHDSVMIWTPEGNLMVIASRNDQVTQLHASGGRTLFQATPEFQSWFGDSTVVDEAGAPRIMYHATKRDFDEFGFPDGERPEFGGFGFHFGDIEAAEGRLSRNRNFHPAHLTQDPSTQGARIMPVYLSIKNPLRMEDQADIFDTPEGKSMRWAQVDEMEANGTVGNELNEEGQAVDPDTGEVFADDAHTRTWENPYSVMLTLEEMGIVTPDEAAAWRESTGGDLPGGIIELLESKGYDGIVYSNTVEGEGGDSFIAFQPEQIKSPFNDGTFDPTDGSILSQDGAKKPRGQIQLPQKGVGKGTSVISLFETADLSTFLHESAHYFLEVMNDMDAPELAQDMAAIRKFVGASEDSKTFTTEQHETFARGFEAYLMEGKAPTLELQSAFAMFKAWLSRVYRSVAGLNVKLTPEIREVFDRMLATDEAIAQARAEQSLRPLFTEKPAGMSDADWRTYQRQARQATEQAEARLLKRTMDKLTREKKTWFKEERAAVVKEVEQRVNALPEYRLVEALGNDRWLGDEETEVPGWSLDRDQLVQEYGQDVLGDLPRGRRTIYGTENAVSLEEAADFFGFQNKEEMIQTLRTAGKRKDRINLEADQVMDERHGDPLNDGTIEAEAMAAVHSEQMAAAAASEVRQLKRELGRDHVGSTSKVYRARAQEMIGNMTVAQASRPAQFLAAERRAARDAEKAFARVTRGGGEQALQAALEAKERQVLNQHLYTASKKVEQEVATGRKKMMRYRKPSVRQKLEGGYIEQIDQLLEQYDFRKRSPGQVERDESLQDFVANMNAQGRGNQVEIDPAVMARAGQQGRHYSRLSVNDLRGLFSTIENIDHLGRLKQMLIDRKEKRNLDTVVQSINNAMRENVKGRAPGRVEQSSEKRRKLGRDYLNTVLNADTLTREIDGFQDMGPTWTNLKQGVDEGMARVTERRFEMGKKFDDIYGRYKGERKKMGKVEFDPELGFSLNQWERIAIALNTGNADNYQRLTNPDVAGSLTPHQVEKALEQLTEKDWETVQMIWDYIDSFWPEIAALEKRSKGTTPPKVQAAMQTPAPAGVTGGYYPIKYDNRLSGLTQDFQNRDLAESLMSGVFGKAQTAQGHTEARNSTATQPLVLDLGVAHQHVDQVIYDLEMREPVSNSWRILQDQRVRSMFTEKGKKADFEALELWLLDTGSGERVAAQGLTSWLRHVRVGFTISRLAVNVSTALIQPTGIAQSAALVGKKAVAKGTIDYMSNPARWVSDVEAVSPMMRERKQTFERDVYNAVGDLQKGPMSGWQKLQRDYILPASFILMQTVQFYAVDMPTWVSAYQKELAISGDETKARQYADLMVKRTQGSGLMADRGALERGTTSATSRQQELPRMFTALGSYMFAKGNVAYERIKGTNYRSPAEVMNLAIDLALLFTLEAVLYSAVKGFLPEEDEPWIPWLAQETAFSAMSTLPYAREVSGAIQGFDGGGIFGSGVNALAKPITQAAQGEFDRPLVQAVIDAGGVLLHLPSSATKSVINGIFDEEMGVKSDISPAEVLGLSKPGHGRSIADLIFEE